MADDEIIEDEGFEDEEADGEGTPLLKKLTIAIAAAIGVIIIMLIVWKVAGTTAENRIEGHKTKKKVAATGQMPELADYDLGKFKIVPMTEAKGDKKYLVLVEITLKLNQKGAVEILDSEANLFKPKLRDLVNKFFMSYTAEELNEHYRTGELGKLLQRKINDTDLKENEDLTVAEFAKRAFNMPKKKAGFLSKLLGYKDQQILVSGVYFREFMTVSNE